VVNKTALTSILKEFTQEILYFFKSYSYKLIEEFDLNTDAFKNILPLTINLE